MLTVQMTGVLWGAPKMRSGTHIAVAFLRGRAADGSVAVARLEAESAELRAKLLGLPAGCGVLVSGACRPGCGIPAGGTEVKPYLAITVHNIEVIETATVRTQPRRAAKRPALVVLVPFVHHPRGDA